MKTSNKKEVETEEVTEEEVKKVVNEPLCEVEDWLWERGINPDHAVKEILRKVRERTRPS